MYHFLKNFLWLAIIVKVRAFDDFVYDYFSYKSVSRVTLFSCENSNDDIQFVRRMNSLGIAVGISHPQFTFYNVTDNVRRRDNWLLGLLFDTRCQPPDVNEKIVSQSTRDHLYTSIHIWLMLASNFEEAIELLDDSSYSSLTDLVIGIENNASYDLYDVYNPLRQAGGILNVTRMGFWDKKNGLNISLTQDKFSRRANMHKIKVKLGAVTKYQAPGISVEDYLQDYSKKSKDPVSKYGHAIMRLVADLFNFTMDITKFDEWAAMVNGTEKGLMVELSKGEVDVMASPCSATSRFAPYGRLSMPGYPYRTFFLLRSNVARLKWTVLWTPFALDSWTATGITVILAVIIITIIQMTEYGEGCIAESGHATFATIGVLCQQGLTFVPNRIAGRIALLFLLFFGVLLLNYYGASVVSARLSEPPDKMNDSLYSLAKSEMKVAAEPYFVVDDNLNSRGLVEWEVRYFNEKIWKKLPMSRYEELEKGMSKVALGGYAYHTSAEVAYPYVESHWSDEAICDMTEIHVITPRNLAFYERLDSPFTEIIKIGLLKTANMGLQRRTVIRWKPKTPYCSSTARSLQSISILEIAPAVMMVTIGIAAALFIFQIERILFKIRPTRSGNILGGPKNQRTGGKRALLRT